MKKVFLMIVCLVAVTYFWAVTNKTIKPSSQSTITPTVKVTDVPMRIASASQNTSLFVPYWSLGSDVESLPAYDAYIYFGISPTQTSINKQDTGYLRLSKFVSKVPEGKQLYLTLRMLEDKTSFAILKDTTKQDAIINETLLLAEENGFDGVVLDLEVSALPFESLIKQINIFTKKISIATKAKHMKFLMTMYGDTFYRIRPFDVKELALTTDQMMIMAYDLHKANSNPGPNFPLAGKDVYGYDYAKLIDHFSSAVPAEKLVVVFGLFGYDWQVDDKNIAQGIGNARSFTEIQQEIINQCTALQCTTKRDIASGETTIHYIDEDGDMHTVWFEDMQSVASKQKYLNKRNIHSFSYWAWSYF